MPEIRGSDLARVVHDRLSADEIPLAEKVRQIFAGFDERHVIRRERPITEPPLSEGQEQPLRYEGAPRLHTTAARRRRLDLMLALARSPEDAVAAAIGTEAWSLGVQMILASPA